MRFLLITFSLIYGSLITFRNILFDWNIFKSKSYNIPIICIGNITTGGTGKTPHIEYILNLLIGKNIAVISRGYGRKSKGLLWVETNSIALEVGDEPLQIKQKNPNTLVLVSENRRKGIEEILVNYPETEVILMDDGFQHRWVKAGLNIILNNYNNPIYSDYLLPYGTLREQKSEIQRADIIITSKCPKNLNPTERQGILSQLNLFSNQQSYFSHINYENWKSVFIDEEINLHENYNITLVTSIANTENLKQYLEENGNKVKQISFPDHHNFTANNIKDIFSEYNYSNSDKNIILSTEKDKVKLMQFQKEFEGIRLCFSPINIEIEQKNQFDKTITDYVTNYKRNI